MKIDIEKNTVSFFPEGLEEKAKIDALWKMIIDCNGSAKKLVPIGEYEPNRHHDAAMFQIEGLEKREQGYTEVRVNKDCVCYCSNCNKQVHLKKGDAIPICCGKVMEIIE